MPTRSHIQSTIPICIAVILVLNLPAWTNAVGSKRAPDLQKKLEKIGQVLVIDGQYVHNVGRLQMNVTNWGCFGSMPNSNYPMSESPSAQWPGGSGVEYLFAAGLWIGAMRNGVPVVSTGYPETEFYPPRDPVHTIYRTTEGAEGGTHYPSNPDDDRDGRIDHIEKSIRVEGDLDEAQRQRLFEMADRCPVHRTLHAEVHIDSSLEA